MLKGRCSALAVFHAANSSVGRKLHGEFSVEFYKVLLRFVQQHLVEAGMFRKPGFDALPDGCGQMFYAWHHAFQERNIFVQVAVVEVLNHFFFDDALQQFQIHDETGIGIGCSFHRNIQIKIVAMPVCVGAFAENGFILRCCPGCIVQLVCCIEMLFPGNV